MFWKARLQDFQHKQDPGCSALYWTTSNGHGKYYKPELVLDVEQMKEGGKKNNKIKSSL